jgi:sulfur transfer complex TusBCD TusB component (DsrH family)
MYADVLAATLRELGANTPLQIYLAEKIFDCLWWMRRYEEQKRLTLVRSMCDQLDPQSSDAMTPLKDALFAALAGNKVSSQLRQMMGAKSYTLESLQQQAFEKCVHRIVQLDELIALKTKTLAGFQTSYEVLVNRTILRERLQLQTALLRRDMAAIEHDQPAQTTGE